MSLSEKIPNFETKAHDNWSVHLLQSTLSALKNLKLLVAL
jgi:hypothetical protein